MVAKKRGLGRGLDALLGAEKPAQREPGESRLPANALQEVPVEFIRPGKYQPRKNIDEGALADLAASISAQGLMQPIVLRTIGEQKYEIIAGERRWRASQLAGMDKVPAVIRDVNDEAAVAMSLIENIQREDLNPMEEAMALKRLIDEFALTHQEVADAVGMSRTGVTNYLRLAQLMPDVAMMLVNGDIEMGHAKVLLGLTDQRQTAAAREVVARGLNVRQTEALVRQMSSPKATKPPAKVDADTRQLEQQLSSRLGQPVNIKHSAKGKGKLIIDYNSLDELDGILNHFGDLG